MKAGGAQNAAGPPGAKETFPPNLGMAETFLAA
jgi:hypothetical protein